MSTGNTEKTGKGYSPTLVVTTVLVLVVVSIIGVFLYVMRSRTQGRWVTQERAQRAQEWVRKVGSGSYPHWHEVIIGGTKDDPRWGDHIKFNERPWIEFMVCGFYGSAWEIQTNAD